MNSVRDTPPNPHSFSLKRWFSIVLLSASIVAPGSALSSPAWDGSSKKGREVLAELARRGDSQIHSSQSLQCKKAVSLPVSDSKKKAPKAPSTGLDTTEQAEVRATYLNMRKIGILALRSVQ